MTKEHDVPFIDSELFHNLRHRDWVEKEQARHQFVETITQNPRVLIPINLGGRVHCVLCLIVQEIRTGHSLLLTIQANTDHSCG
jgi:hypothetical protein